MIDGKIYGTDCFEVELFLQRNEFSKLYQVKSKEDGKIYLMEVSPRDANSRAPVSPYVQLTKTLLSSFWVSLRFAFQTRSKFYFILDFAGGQTLSRKLKFYGGKIPEPLARFYAAEIVVALEELHSFRLAYKDLDLDAVYVDSEGHIKLWRSFCGKLYWVHGECICSLAGFFHGDPCNNNHNLTNEFDFQEDWKALGTVINAILTGDNNQWTSENPALSASASDLISRLRRGDISRADQIQSHPFFKGISWHEVRTRKARPSVSTDKGSNSSPVQTNPSAGYSPTGANITNLPSSFYRPHSLSHHSDPGDTRYLKSAPDYMVHESGLCSGFSTPDLRSINQVTPFLRHHTSLPPRDMYYHYGNPGYPSTTPRDFQSSPVQRRLASRSLSDLSALNGHDDAFVPNPQTTLNETFIYSNHELAPQYARTFYTQPGNHSGVLNGDYALRSTGSFPDLRSNVGPFTSCHYTSHDGRSSPTPSGYIDYSSCTEPPLRGTFMLPHQTLRYPYSDIGVSSLDNFSVIGLRRWERSSTRDSENHRGSSEPENNPRGNPHSLHSERSAIDASSSPGKNPSNKSSTQQSSSQRSDFTKKNDSDRTSTNTTRERSSTLTRTLSLSDMEEGTKHTTPKEVRETRRDSLPIGVSNAREKYPLARVPIPSFREFKQRNLLEDTKNKPLIEKKDANDGESQRSPRADSKTESKSKIEMRGKLKERLSSLYESSKDISAQNSTRKLSTSYKLNSSNGVTSEKSSLIKSSDLTETKGSITKDIKDLGGSRKISRGRRESPFSKNEVIHNLMLKYGLYEKGGHKRGDGSRADAKDIGSSTDKVSSRENKRNNKNLKHISSAAKSENVLSREERRTQNYSQLKESTPRGSAISDRKTATAATFESKKSAAERFRELRRKHVLQNDSEDSRAAERLTLTSRGKTLERNSVVTASITENGKQTPRRGKNQNNSGEIQGGDHTSTPAGLRKANSKVEEGSMALYENTAKRNVDSKSNNNSETSIQGECSIGLRGTSRAILCATKFKRAANKGSRKSNDSPLPDKKKLGDIITKNDSATKIVVEKMQDGNSIEIKRDESLGKRSPNTGRRDFRTNGKLRKGGIHTSMLSVASNACLTDSEVDDTISLYSKMDSLDSERETRGRRWESFHSNISADSGSAHMFEFDTDSNTTEFEEEVFDDRGSEDEHPKSEAEVERTDSGVGGDMGQGPVRRSWEEIVMKSSEHWSVVAASARHWQELARRKKANDDEMTTARKRSSVHSITEDMVECPDCLKHYVPAIISEEQKDNSKEPEICPKCKDRKVERKEAIIELVQTEINYGNDLQILKEEFYLPMQSGGILSPENLAAIFLNLQELLEVNSKFCAKLQKSLEKSVAKGDEEFSNVNVGSIFLESVDFFQAYEIYCSKQTTASALLESLQKKTELLRIFLNVTCRENPKCRKMDLNSFILAPVQRIMKYPLLLSRICKATPRRNQDREKLKMAQRRIEEQLNKINALNTAVESRQKRYRASQQLGRSDSLDKLQMKKMASDILNWTIEEMELLMHGVFQITIHEFGASWNRRSSKKALSVCALFCVRGHSEFVRINSDDEGECEDLLFPGEGEVTDAAVVLLRKKMSGKYTLFKEPLFLDMCVIYKECELKDAFEIVLMGKETYRFRASTSRDYRRWLKYLRLESKELGSWKRRRNGLPNIMIKNL